MDFELSDEQRLLRDTVERLLSDHYSFDDRRRYQALKRGFSEEMWRRYAQLGLLSVPFPEAYGGLGRGWADMMIIMEAFGKALILEPYFATVVLAGGILRHGASEAQKAELIPAIALGQAKLAFAYAEPQSRYDLSDVETRATRGRNAWLLNGHKSLVLHGDVADKIIVSARTAGEARDKNGIGLFLIDANSVGVARRGYWTQDGLRAAEITFKNASVEANNVIGDPAGALPHISRVADEAVAALCAEAVGSLAEMHALTCDYLKLRHQFGTPLASFQVLQHRAVEMFIELELSRSMAIYAALMVAEDNACKRERTVSAAKAQVGGAAKLIGRQSIQLHGGIGMTMEHRIGHYFKHVTMIDMLFGDTAHHLRRLAERGGLVDEFNPGRRSDRAEVQSQSAEPGARLLTVRSRS